MMVRHAAVFLAHHPGQRTAQPGPPEAGDVAHLALQAQHLHRVPAAVGSPARQQEARQPRPGLGQHQEGTHIGARRILVAHQSSVWPGPLGADREGARVLARTSEPPCFLGRGCGWSGLRIGHVRGRCGRYLRLLQRGQGGRCAARLTAAKVMVIGQPCLAPDLRGGRWARAPRAPVPGRSRRRMQPVLDGGAHQRSGWMKRTWSMRRPNRSCVSSSVVPGWPARPVPGTGRAGEAPKAVSLSCAQPALSAAHA